MTPTITIYHDAVNAIIICPRCEQHEFVQTSHTFKPDSNKPDYVFTCVGCGFTGTLDKMKLKNLSSGIS